MASKHSMAVALDPAVEGKKNTDNKSDNKGFQHCTTICWYRRSGVNYFPAEKNTLLKLLSFKNVQVLVSKVVSDCVNLPTAKAFSFVKSL